MEAIIKRAQVAGQPVMLMYLSQKGLITKRMVSVERFDEKWIEGYCHMRKSYRRFHRDNILALYPSNGRKRNCTSL